MPESLDKGKAGEFLVVSELLFRNFNANIMSVDTGIDVVAIKENKTYLVQVKTSKRYPRNYYHYDITMKALDKFNSGDVFYIFVMRDNNRNNFMILSTPEIERQIREGGIKIIESHNKYRVSFRENNGRIYVGNKDHDLTYYLNNWDVLK